MTAYSTSRRIVLVLFVVGLSAPLWLRGQQPPRIFPPAAANSRRLSFDVVQSFDAKYEGDTPGHLGRVGGLENRRPKVALGDPIYRDDVQVGRVTALTWNRGNGSLDIEFDPVAMTRIAVGDDVWLLMSDGASSSNSSSGSSISPADKAK